MAEKSHDLEGGLIRRQMTGFIQPGEGPEGAGGFQLPCALCSQPPKSATGRGQMLGFSLALAVKYLPSGSWRRHERPRQGAHSLLNVNPIAFVSGPEDLRAPRCPPGCGTSVFRAKSLAPILAKQMNSPSETNLCFVSRYVCA